VKIFSFDVKLKGIDGAHAVYPSQARGKNLTDATHVLKRQVRSAFPGCRVQSITMTGESEVHDGDE